MRPSGGRLDWFESTEILLLAGVSAACLVLLPAFLQELRGYPVNKAGEVLAGYVTRFSPFNRHVGMPGGWDLSEPAGLAAINEVVSREALMIACADGFRILAAASLFGIVLCALIRKPDSQRP